MPPLSPEYDCVDPSTGRQLDVGAEPPTSTRRVCWTYGCDCSGGHSPTNHEYGRQTHPNDIPTINHEAFAVELVDEVDVLVVVKLVVMDLVIDGDIRLGERLADLLCSDGPTLVSQVPMVHK